MSPIPMHTETGVLATAAAAEESFFEGSEKRLEVDFVFTDGARGSNGSTRGLRDLTREQLDNLLELAACTIVSTYSNAFMDAYVLSESSLFVLPTKLMLKTCGTTTLLQALPTLLQLAENVGLALVSCKYSRTSFKNPGKQLFPHQSFDDEVDALDASLGGLPSRSYVLGDSRKSNCCWHVYVAVDDARAQQQEQFTVEEADVPFTLECCMEGMREDVCGKFFYKSCAGSAATCTVKAGIDTLLSGFVVDDFLFEPCGYSMNGVDDGAFATIHVTPEVDCSYASVETCGATSRTVQPALFVQDVAERFRPRRLLAALSYEGHLLHGRSGASADVHTQMARAVCNIDGYHCDGVSVQSLPLGGNVFFFTLLSSDCFAAQKEFSPKVCWRKMSSLFGLVNAVQHPAKSANDDEPTQVLRSNQLDDKSKTAMSPKSRLDDDLEMAESVDVTGGGVPPVVARPVQLAPVSSVGAPKTMVVPRKLTGAGSDAYEAYAKQLINDKQLDEPFYLMDLGKLKRRWAQWQSCLPRIVPYYAVKCNNDPGLLDLLVSLGAGFDCASEAEVMKVCAAGADPNKIVYGSPCKMPRHIRAATDAGVNLTVYDSVGELYKTHKYWPNARLLLRIREDDPQARCQLGTKYGANADEFEELLRCAADLQLHVVGVAFHVGSGASDPQAFYRAVRTAGQVFELGKRYGFKMDTLDVGGGFPGGGTPEGQQQFAAIATCLNSALEEFFPQGDVRLIAEPGRFFAENSATLVTNIFGKRVRSVGGDDRGARSEAAVEKVYEYWIGDGLYGNMNCVMYDHAVVRALPLQVASESNGSLTELKRSVVFGPTCDGLDTVLQDVQLPELEYGDWLYFPDMGAYTLCAASAFNGFTPSSTKVFYVESSG